jgi:hypothetical protein
MEFELGADLGYVLKPPLRNTKKPRTRTGTSFHLLLGVFENCRDRRYSHSDHLQR